MSSLNLVDLPLQLILDHFLLFELVNERGFFFFDLPGKSVLLHEPLRDVLDAHSNAVAFILSQEGLGCDIPDCSFDLVTSLDGILELALNVSDFLRLQLQSKVLLLDSLILLIDAPHFVLHLSHVVLGLFEDGLIVLKVTLEALHLDFRAGGL